MIMNVLKGFIFVTALFCPGAFNALAETLPILCDGRSWIWDSGLGNIDDGVGDDYRHILIYSEVVGDTIVDGMTLKKIDRRSDSPQLYVGYLLMKEEAGVLYQYQEDIEWPEELKEYYRAPGLYPVLDMNMQEGDKSENVSVKKVDFIEDSAGNMRKCIILSDIDDAYWVEGIGLSRDLYVLTPSQFPRPTCGPEKMLECRQNGEIIFTEEDFKRPTAGVEDIYTDDKDPADESYYDLRGYSVRTAEPGCIYIHKGKKTVQISM